MRVPLSWLKDFTPLSTEAFDPAAVEELRLVLDSLGLVVESIETVGSGLSEVVLARVLEIEAIKGASRIRLVTVDAGDEDPLEIVCGATNFALGDVVPLARVGAMLPSGMTIEARKMLGTTSNGMLCSGLELGLNDEEMGLLILASPGGRDAPLPEDIELGRPIAEHLGISPDVVYDVAVEPNRPDCLSVIGIARDVAARLSLPFFVPEPHPEESGRPIGEVASASISDHAACRQLVVRVVSGLSAVPSPPLVKRRLALSGMRSINAVVDASNYVMLELGQPTHPYDLDRLGGAGIGVRLAHEREEVVTLDEKVHVLGLDRSGSRVEDAVITDADGVAVGLAGIMGGHSSEITDATTAVLLEVAEFEPLVLGGTSARVGLRTDAFSRFWRGIDPEGLERAADRFCELVEEAHALSGAPRPVVHPGRLVVRPGAHERVVVEVSTGEVNRLLGTNLEDDEVVSYLEPIGFKVQRHAEALRVEVPSFRPDVSRPVDVIEEVARHHGYENIDRRDRRSPKVGRLGSYQEKRRLLRRLLVGLGAMEVSTSSLVEGGIEDALGATGAPVVVTNPIVASESSLRRHVLPGLVGVLSYNAARRANFLRLFEIGRVFSRNGEDRPFEHEELAVLFALKDDGAATAFEALMTIADGLRIDRRGFVIEQTPPGEITDPARPPLVGLHPSRGGWIVARDEPTKVLGLLGEVDPAALEEIEPKGRRAGALVVDLEAFFMLPRRDEAAVAVSRYPSSDIDLAFLLDEAVPARRVGEVLESFGDGLLESVRLLDAYHGPALPEGTRSLTYRLRFSSLERTLSDGELSGLRSRAIATVEEALPARLRG